MTEHRIHVFVLIDALGWEFIKGREFLNDVLPFRRPLRTVLGFSSGAIPAILTGVPPAQNGHWNLIYHDPNGSPFRWLRPFRSLLPDHRVTRKALKELGRRVLGLGPLFECCVRPDLLPFFNWVEKQNIFEQDAFAGARSIFDALAADEISFRVYSYHRWTDQEILRRAGRDIRSRAASVFFLYLSEMDAFLHNFCSEPQRIEERLLWYEAKLREVFGSARSIDAEASLLIFSDHGMRPVSHHYDLVREVEDAGFTMPVDYLCVYDSTMARFWFFSDTARQSILDRLHSAPCGRVLADDDLRELGVFFSDRRYGEVVFLMHPGWLMSRSDFHGGRWLPAGMHGYHPDDSGSDAVFLSDREPLQPVRTIADIYSCMARVLA